MTDDEILALMIENDELKAALLSIATFDASEEHGYVDEWEEAGAFTACQQIARTAIHYQP